MLFGFVTVSAWIGRLIYDEMHHAPHAPGKHIFVQALLGMAILIGTTLVPAVLLPKAVLPLMVMLLYFASCVGIASFILSKFGTLTPPKHLHRYHLVHAQGAPAMHHPAAHVVYSPPPEAGPPA